MELNIQIDSLTSDLKSKNNIGLFPTSTSIGGRIISENYIV